MKYIKTFRILAIALTLALLATALPATAVLAAEVITLDTYQGRIGQSITVTGSGFIPSTDTTSRGVNIIFGKNNPGASVDYATDTYETVKIAEVDSEGAFSTTFLVPGTLTGGVNDEAVTRGIYYVYLTYYFPNFTPPTSGTTVLTTTTFTVVTGEITLDPAEGTVGTEVKVTGEGYGNREKITVEYDGSGVNIESGDDNTNSNGDFEFTILVPGSTAGSHTITVTGDDSGIQAEAAFAVEEKITISPESGTVGGTVTVSGTGFAASQSVTISFDSVGVGTSQTNNVGSFAATFNVPALGVGNYNVEAADGSGNSVTVPFTLAVATASFDPLEGYIGDEVTVSGTSFQASQPITVTFYNENVATGYASSSGSFSISFTVPVLPAGTYRVRVSDGINTEENYFKIKILTSASISPVTSAASPGHVGTNVTVSGDGFVAGRTVTITYDGAQVTTTTVNADGTFSATFAVPASSAGEHSIIATDLTNTKQFTFTMESTPPPTPQLLKPEMDIKAEAEAYFDWEEVTDPSGLTYILQIATDEGFAEGSIVMEKTGLIQSEYTITEEEKLESVSQEAPYYWRVRAIDGASNEGQWSGARSFYVAGAGFSLAMPQPLIYTLFGIGALLLGIFGFWLGRKTAYY